jgi:hypothetical protein
MGTERLAFIRHSPGPLEDCNRRSHPKPNRADYFAAKNFCPISLLECLSKLLEKAVSKRLLFAIDKYELIPTTQFGT